VFMATSAQRKFGKEEIEADETAPAIESPNLLSLRELEEKYEAMRARLGDRVSEYPDCELLRAQIELAKAERDRAGAIKFKGYVRRNRKLFDDRKGEAAVALKETKDGPAYVASPEFENRRYLFVNLSELDRLNKEGHNQAAGDAGLEALVKAAVKASGAKTEGLTVYRFGGNEYMLEFSDISELDIMRVEDNLLKAELDLGDFKHLEAPPLSVARMSFAEVLDIMSTVDLVEAEAGEKDAYEAAGESVSVMTRLAEYSLEIEKFETRVRRAVEKLDAVKNGHIGRGDAEVFFDTYLKKGFSGTDLDSLKKVEELWMNGADRKDFDRTVNLMAVESARTRFADDRKFQLYIEHLASGTVREYLRATAASNERGQKEAPADFFDPDIKIAKIPDPKYGTDGLRKLLRKKEQIGKRGGKWIKVDETLFEGEAMRRDENTGLEERGRFYEELEDEIKKEKEFSLIFIDLGFLKYFNDAGRRAVGDAALLLAAEIMEEAVMRSETKADIYRYGGDEFTVMVHGSRTEAKGLCDSIKDLAVEMGRVPDLHGLRQQGFAKDTTGESRPDYAPMELVFNFGIADVGDVNKLINDMGSEELAGILQEGRRTEGEFKADLMVKLADASVGYDKAVSRFHELLEMMSEPGYEDENSLVHKRVESVIAASRKAIFAGQGGEAALRFWAEGQEIEDRDVLNRQIERFVSDRVEKISDVMKSKKELVDKLVEIHATRNRLRGEVERLRSELADDDERIAELRIRLDEADAARREIIKNRQIIASGGH
jgi:GGDEF domain-containing protein